MKVFLKIVTDSAKEAMEAVSDVDKGRLPIEVKGKLDGVEIVQPSTVILISRTIEAPRESKLDVQS